MIFRKNIGRALLNKENNPFLEFWELDLTTKENKDKYSAQVDLNKQKEIEKKVTKCIQENFSFVVFEVNDKDERLSLESKIISTISSCKYCKATDNWLGKFSPKEKIRDSGLWLVNECYKIPLTEYEFVYLKHKVLN